MAPLPGVAAVTFRSRVQHPTTAPPRQRMEGGGIAIIRVINLKLEAVTQAMNLVLTDRLWSNPTALVTTVHFRYIHKSKPYSC